MQSWEGEVEGAGAVAEEAGDNEMGQWREFCRIQHADATWR